MQTRSQSRLLQSKPSAIMYTRSSPNTTIPQSSSPITRSQTKPAFDFDESSSTWLLNKNKLGNGMYSYNGDKSNCTESSTSRPTRSSNFSGITTRSGLVLSA